MSKVAKGVEIYKIPIYRSNNQSDVLKEQMTLKYLLL